MLLVFTSKAACHTIKQPKPFRLIMATLCTKLVNTTTLCLSVLDTQQILNQDWDQFFYDKKVNFDKCSLV